MNTQMIEEKIWDLSMEIGKLKAGNKILKSVNDSLIQALHKPVVGGKKPAYKTIHAAAVEYAQKEWAHANDVDTEKKHSINDFHAGAQWALSQVACATAKEGQTGE